MHYSYQGPVNTGCSLLLASSSDITSNIILALLKGYKPSSIPQFAVQQLHTAQKLLRPLPQQCGAQRPAGTWQGDAAHAWGWAEHSPGLMPTSSPDVQLTAARTEASSTAAARLLILWSSWKSTPYVLTRCIRPLLAPHLPALLVSSHPEHCDKPSAALSRRRGSAATRGSSREAHLASCA